MNLQKLKYALADRVYTKLLFILLLLLLNNKKGVLIERP